jgi:hypothetical protein
MKNPFSSPPDPMASAPGESGAPSLSASPASSPWGDAGEPIRVLAGGGNAFARSLLESAHDDGIPDAPLQRLARTLNVPPLPAATLLASSGAALPASGADRWGSLRWAYTASLVGLGAFGVLSIGERIRSEAEQTPLAQISVPLDMETSSRAAVSNGEPSPLAPLITETAASIVSSNESTAQTHASAPAPIRATQTQHRTKIDTRAASADATPSTDATSTLMLELRALEAAQLALRAGRTGDAERALDEYARRFPRAKLALEAELLHVDVSLARGERAVAVERARALSARPGAARYRERLDRLLKDAATDR